jgi:hypothetical protein
MEVRDARSKGEDGWLLAHAWPVQNKTLDEPKKNRAVGKGNSGPFPEMFEKGALLPVAGPDEPAQAIGLPAPSS